VSPAKGRRLAVPEGGFTRIAILRLSSLGDVILSIPVVHALRQAFPQARIEFWTKEEYADVLRFDPAISHVRALERDARRIEDLVSMSAELEDCDLIVDLHRNARTRVLTFRQRAPVLRAPSYRLRRARWVHARWTDPQPTPHALTRFAAALAPLGLGAAEVPRVEAGDEAERWAAAWLEQRGLRRPVALAPAARHATKRWPEAYWVEIVERLAGRGVAMIAFSLDSERRTLPALAQAIESAPNAAWCTESLPRIGALLSRARGALTSDSGLMHLAAARGLEVVAMFGSTAPELGFAPAGEGHQVLCRHEPCQPCTLHGRERCPRGHFRCMIELRPDAVWDALAPRLEDEPIASGTP
jgi:heptosyltransferase-2